MTNKQIESLQGTGTLTLDGSRVLRVSYSITVYQKLLEGVHAGYLIRGSVTPSEMEAPFVPCGQKENILELSDGRKLEIVPPGLLHRFQSFQFENGPDQFNFFDTPLYRKLEEEQR